MIHGCNSPAILQPLLVCEAFDKSLCHCLFMIVHHGCSTKFVVCRVLRLDQREKSVTYASLRSVHLSALLCSAHLATYFLRPALTAEL